MTAYIKRSGPMVFWRLGRIGGSFYLANSAQAQERAKGRTKRELWKALNHERKRAAHWAQLWREAYAINERYLGAE